MCWGLGFMGLGHHNCSTGKLENIIGHDQFWNVGIQQLYNYIWFLLPYIAHNIYIMIKLKMMMASNWHYKNRIDRS